MSSSTAAPTAGEGGQPAVEVGPTTKVVGVITNIPSSVLANRKQDDGARVSSHKK